MSTQTNNPLFPPQSSTPSPIHAHPLSLEQQEADPVVGQGRPLRSPWWGVLQPPCPYLSSSRYIVPAMLH